MWIIIAIIVFFLFARALNNASKKSGHSWTEEDEQAYWDEDLD